MRKILKQMTVFFIEKNNNLFIFLCLYEIFSCTFWLSYIHVYYDTQSGVGLLEIYYRFLMVDA